MTFSFVFHRLTREVQNTKPNFCIGSSFSKLERICVLLNNWSTYIAEEMSNLHRLSRCASFRQKTAAPLWADLQKLFTLNQIKAANEKRHIQFYKMFSSFVFKGVKDKNG